MRPPWICTGVICMKLSKCVSRFLVSALNVQTQGATAQLTEQIHTQYVSVTHRLRSFDLVETYGPEL